jgi:hypothetical protein
MRNMILRAALVPILIGLAGLHTRKRRRNRGRPPGDNHKNDTDHAREVAHEASLDGEGASGTNPTPTNNTQPAPERPLLDPPAGFQSKADYEAFRDRLNSGLHEAGYTDARPILQGSATDGFSHNPSKPANTPFDGGAERSDYDIAIASPSLMDAARDNDVGLRSQGTRTGPLRDEQLRQLGLIDLRNDLQRMAGGREVHFMGYTDAQAAVDRATGPSNSMSPPYGGMSRS